MVAVAAKAVNQVLVERVAERSEGAASVVVARAEAVVATDKAAVATVEASWVADAMVAVVQVVG
eukprot:4017957-Prymnesium_polylepis.1